ncbi:MAG TPA: VWA domain-containing protein, partial [Chthoniobacterales bacterium]|nr:VWA domain-containing protein [Chthoniobacterales bacterium]
ERRGAKRLQEFASARLLPQLAGTVNHFRRVLRFGLLLLGFALAIVSLAQPRWGYTFQDVQRKGLDLLLAVDTSRSMLSNDVQPNRLERVKLATQDLINELQGDRVGLIAFAGRAFVQAPLTIDYDAVTESINDLDTKTIPEGGTNISQAIARAVEIFGKSATGNRALIIFTDGEELSGDAVKSAKDAAEAGVRIFTVGVGTSEGSLIPVTGDDGGTAFVKDPSGRVVKSKLDEKRLRETAQATEGFYLHLENGPRSMKQIYEEGLAKMQAANIDVRLSRRPIERYEWPLGAAILALAMSILIGERKRVRQTVRNSSFTQVATAAAALFLFCLPCALAAVPGLQLYGDGKYTDAYQSFLEDLKNNPDSPVKDKMQFDAGTAAYKMRDYNKALEAFSGSLLSRDKSLQEDSHFNIGRTLEERADMDKANEEALKDLVDAQSHYESVLQLDPSNEAAKSNLEMVKKKIERLKEHPKEKPPTPTPPPPPPQKKNNNQNQENQQDQQQSSEKDQQQQNQQQQQQSQGGSGNKENQKGDQGKDQSQAKNDQQKQEQPRSGESPSPSPTAGEGKANQPSPSPSAGQQKESEKGQGKQPSPSPGQTGSPSPSPGNDKGEGENATPSPAPSGSPQKKFAGEVKGAPGDKSEKPPDKNAEMVEAEQEKEGQMSERQAEALLQSMKDEEARVQLDERKATRRVYNDW